LRGTLVSYAIIPSLPQYGASKFTKDVIRILE
jgi:hypothetical protein